MSVRLSQFDYLGVTLTTQLAYSKHLEKINARARAKVGHIFATTSVGNVSAKLAMELFDVYIKPMYDYCAAIWTTKVCKSALDNMDRVYLKYWKRYLQVRRSSSANITYLVTGTYPLSERILENPTKALESINLSINLEGHQLQLIKNKPVQPEKYIFQKEVPEKVWEILQAQKCLPSNPELRKKFTSKLFDLQHIYQCKRLKKDFHKNADPLKCKCVNCNEPMDWYHECQPILDSTVAS